MQHIKSICQSLLAVLGALTFASCLSAQDAESRSEPVIEAVEKYVEAFNKRDANAIANLWASDGEHRGPDDEAVKGTANIRQSFAQLFESLPAELALSVDIQSLHFVTDDVVLEEGIANFGGQSERYMAVHKQENGNWRLFKIKQLEAFSNAPASNYQYLQPLEWLVGEWIDDSEDAIVESTCQWSKNNNFLTVNFRVSAPDEETLEGTQVIGYDPSRQQIRSWTFNSDGGFSQGTWTLQNDQWIVHQSSVLPDGQTSTATNVFAPESLNEFRWKSTERNQGGIPQADIDWIKVVRVVGTVESPNNSQASETSDKK